MIGQLNLASRPFRNRTLPWAVIVAVGGFSLVALALTLSQISQTSSQVAEVQSGVARERELAAALQQRADRVRSALSPEEVRTLEDAHRIVEQKRFPWSRLLVDLEGALPTDVRVDRVSVSDVSRDVGDGRVYADLELEVVGREPSDVTRMIGEMARSGVFEAVPVSQNVLDAKSGGGVEFALKVRYRPRSFVITNTAGVNNSTTERRS